MSASTVQAVILAEQFAALRQIAVRRGWTLAPVAGREDTVRLTLRAKDGEAYELQIECDAFPVQPPRFLWRNPETGALGETAAMPAPGGYFHSSGRICAPWNRTASEEGGPHADWADSDWRENPKTGATLTLSAMAIRIAHELQGTNYTGRRA